MNPENVATHFARVRALCEKFDIDETRLINLDESGFSIRMTNYEYYSGNDVWGIKVRCEDRYTSEKKFRGTCDHVTLMPVLSASEQIYTPLVVLPVTACYRYLQDQVASERQDTVNGVTVSMRHPLPFFRNWTTFSCNAIKKMLVSTPAIQWIAGVDTNIFFSWCRTSLKKLPTRGGTRRRFSWWWMVIRYDISISEVCQIFKRH